MAEENTEGIIRKGLIQFIGAFLSKSSLKGKAGRQVAAAVLSEEAVKIAMEGEKPDMYVAKPVLRAAAFLLKSRILELEIAEREADGRSSSLLAKKRKAYEDTVRVLESITEKTFEGGN